MYHYHETLRGFKEILDGKHDDLPEGAFYMVGTIDEAVAKSKGNAREGGIIHGGTYDPNDNNT